MSHPNLGPAKAFIQDVSFAPHYKDDADQSVASNAITLSMFNLTSSSKAVLEHPRWPLGVKLKNGAFLPSVFFSPFRCQRIPLLQRVSGSDAAEAKG